MPTYTPELNLELYNGTTDRQAKFYDWSMGLNGNVQSNMTKIDDWAKVVNTSLDDMKVNTIFLDCQYVSIGYYESINTKITTLEKDMIIYLKFTSDSDGSTTLKINDLTPIGILKIDSNGISTNIKKNDLKKNKIYISRCDGTDLIIIGSTSADQIVYNPIENGFNSTDVQTVLDEIIQFIKPSYEICEIQHNLNKYPNVLVMNENGESGAGCGGAGEIPCGGSNFETENVKIVYVDYNKIKLKINEKYNTYGIPTIVKTNENIWNIIFPNYKCTLLVLIN